MLFREVQKSLQNMNERVKAPSKSISAEFYRFDLRGVARIYLHDSLSVARFWSNHGGNKCTCYGVKSRAFASTSTVAFYEQFTRDIKINEPLSGLLVCRLIMPLAETLPSKFHICPRSFASRPDVHFSDNLSTAGIISRHTSRLKEFIY